MAVLQEVGGRTWPAGCSQQPAKPRLAVSGRSERSKDISKQSRVDGPLRTCLRHSDWIRMYSSILLWVSAHLTGNRVRNDLSGLRRALRGITGS